MKCEALSRFEPSNHYRVMDAHSHRRRWVITRIATALAASITIAAQASAGNSPSTNEVVQGNTALALDLLRLESAKPGNVFFSPYSISAALAMTFAGARGTTETEMARALHFTLAPAQLHRAFGALAHRFDEIAARTNVALTVANSLWYQQDYHLTENFLKLNREYYRAEVRPLDFAGAPDAACQKINSWVAHKTQDRIRDLLSQVPRATRLVLCNAIYFKGTWANPFEERRTHPQPFYVKPDQPLSVPLMSEEISVRTHAEAGVDLFTLPYAGDDISMVILLPKARDGLAALEKELDATKLRDWVAATEAAPFGRARILLPKFKLDLRLELNADLKSLGMPTAFEAGAADFSGMDGSRNLFIGDVVHQAYVDVNEQGTEAAAATAVTMLAMSVHAPPPEFRVDHPFLFLIRDNQTGAILFLGRVVDPSK